MFFKPATLKSSFPIAFLSLALIVGCGGVSTSSSGNNPGNPNPTGNPAPTPQQGIVVVVMEENHGYGQVIGPSSPMPYLNSLTQRGSLLTQYFADAHPSLPNYLELTSGAIETMDDNFSGVISNDNLAREIAASGKTWKAYAEDLPSPGYLGGDVGNYVKRHNPFAYYSDVINDGAQAANVVPFTQFSADMSSGTLPSFSLVIPDLLDDAHSCPDGPLSCSGNDRLSRADQWLSTNIGPLLSSSQFQNNGVLLILFDEANVEDVQHGGGHIPLVAVGPKVKAGFQSMVLYQHENTLRTICDALAVKTCPGSGATVSSESDMFQP